MNLPTHAQVMLILGCITVLLSANALASRFATHTRSVLRQHYGIMFRPVDTFDVVTGYWLHTFGFSLPSRPSIHETRELNCTTVRNVRNATHCSHAKPFVEALSDVQSKMSNMLLDMLVNIERIIPARRPVTTRTRHTRSWLPFIGNISKTVCGTATQDDIQKLTQAVDEIRRSSAQAYNQWATSEGEMASLIHMSTRRTDILRRMLAAQRHTAESQYREISDSLDEVYSMTTLLPTAIARVSNFANVMVHLTQLRIALLDALHGKLNDFLIDTSHMSMAMHRITREIHCIHPDFRTTFASPAEAYQHSDFIIHRVNRDVLITIKFPLTPIRQPYTLYEVVVFPVALPGDSQHVTKLNVHSTHFAFNPANAHYISFRTLPPVRNHLLDLFHVRDTLTASESCIYPLFTNMVSYVREHCTFTLIPDGLISSAMLLDANTVLFLNVPNVTRSCANSEDVILPGCTQCIYELPCRCCFRTDNAYIPPMMSKCKPLSVNDTTVAMTHITNLAVLSTFFSTEDLGQLAADTVLHSPIHAILPEFRFLDHNYSENLAAFDKTSFNLAKAANLSISNEITYRSLSEYLSHTQSILQAESEDIYSNILKALRSPITVISFVFSTLALILIAILSVKLRALSMFLALKPVHAVPTYFNYFTPTSSPIHDTTSVSTLFVVENDTLLVLFVIICASLLLVQLLYNLVRDAMLTWNYQKPTVKLFINVVTPSMSIYLPFLDLYNDLSYYCFLGTTRAKRFSVSGTLFPSLHVDWYDLKLMDSVNNVEISLPHGYKLTLAQATSLRALCPYTDSIKVILYSYHTGATSPIPISCIPHEEPSAPVCDIQQEPPNKLYPIV